MKYTQEATNPRISSYKPKYKSHEENTVRYSTCNCSMPVTEETSTAARGKCHKQTRGCLQVQVGRGPTVMSLPLSKGQQQATLPSHNQSVLLKHSCSIRTNRRHLGNTQLQASACQALKGAAVKTQILRALKELRASVPQMHPREKQMKIFK